MEALEVEEEADHSKVTAMTRVAEASREISETKRDQALNFPKTAEEPRVKRRREVAEISEET